MEQARVTSPQGQQVAHATRGKPSAQGKDSLAEAQGGAAPGGFMALLAALGDGSAPEALVPQVAAEDPLATEPASSDLAAQAVSQGGLLSWQWAAAMAGGGARCIAPSCSGAGCGAPGGSRAGSACGAAGRFGRRRRAVGQFAGNLDPVRWAVAGGQSAVADGAAGCRRGGR